jgi:hypothetical protein
VIDTPPATDSEAVEDFGILVTDEIDQWMLRHDAGADLREDPGEVVIDFLRDPRNEQLVAAVLASRGWIAPGRRACLRAAGTRNLKGSHGTHCSLTDSE